MKPLARGLSHAFAGVPSVPGVILSLHELPPPQVMNAAMAEQPLEFMASKHGVSSKHGTRSGGGVSPNVYGLSTVRSGGGGGEILSISAKPPERGGCREGQSPKMACGNYHGRKQCFCGTALRGRSRSTTVADGGAWPWE